MSITSRLSTALAGRYKIERHIGEGGMANVYLAEDLKHERKVALKVLRPELAVVLGAERFVQEIKTTANLQHPHILPLFDSGTAGQSDGGTEFLYYVMPYIEGETLRDKLSRETQLGIEEAVQIACNVADALHYAHRNGVIHRDIKPENILLHDGRPMVADFGIALAVSAAAGGRMTETGLSLGTPHYMSPEQATAEKDLTARSDVYSLASVLFELLTGEPPHMGNSAQQIIMKIVTDTARPVTELRKSVPPHVAATVAKGLEKLPADRFESAGAFAEALTNPTFTLPTTQAALAAAGQVDGGPWKLRALVATALAGVLTLLAAWGWLWGGGGGEAGSAGVARYRIVLPEEETFGRFGPSITMSPDGSDIVYVGPSENGVQLLHKSRDQLIARPLPGTDGAFTPKFSPDGRRVAFYVNPQTVKVVSLDGAPPVAIADSGINNAVLSWGHDGYIYTTDQQFRVVRIPEDGGPPETLAEPDSNQLFFAPDPLPNGRGMIVGIAPATVIPDQYSVGVVDFTTGEARVVVRGVLAQYAASGHLVFVRVDGAVLAAAFDQDRMEMTGAPVPLFDGVRIKDGGTIDFALSTGGTLVYGAGESLGAGLYGSATAVWVDRDGTSTPVDPAWSFNLPRTGSLALSPDGTRLALDIYEGTVDIWIKQLDRGPLTRLTFEGGENTGVAWQPSGRSVSFSSGRSGTMAMFSRRADGTGVAEPLLGLDAAVWDGQWSLDAEWFVVRRGGSNQGPDLWAFRPGVDSVATPLLESSHSLTMPRISPNGSWLVYTSDESGEREVYVRPFPNVDDGRWQISSNGGTEPMWAHSGRELFYVSGADEMVSVSVVTDGAFEVGGRQVLFQVESWRRGGYPRHYYDVTPDDRRFLMIRDLGAAVSTEVILVENFLEELKARVDRP